MKLLELYETRYAGDMKFKTSPKGLHSVIVQELGKSLHEKTVLDIGCGAGRLALFCASRGAKVTGVDFSENAIELCNAICHGLVDSPAQLTFEVADFESMEGQYDIVLLTEVFEHIEKSPPETLERLRELVKPGGTMVVSCPGFVNFRGMVWMTLQNLFGFLMSPSDVHFIFPWQMKSWCQDLGIEIEKHLGLFYDWGWGEWAAEDMKQRIAFALRDQKKSDPNWQDVTVDLDRMAKYFQEQAMYFEDLMRSSSNALIQQKHAPSFQGVFHLVSDIANTSLGLQIEEYLADAGGGKYTDLSPFNAFGANNLFFCKPQ